MKVQQKRLIQQLGIKVECFFYNYFKSPGLKQYPNLTWINDDYHLIKQEKMTVVACEKLALNLFNVGKKHHLFEKCDYLIMMPKKTTSISSLENIINEVVSLIQNELNDEIKFINNLFQVENYRKFWENRLKVSQRQTEIANKIHLLPEYNNFFNNKNIIIIDDVVASGISLAEVISQILLTNHNVQITALCYGSVYHWEEIYNN